MNPTFATIIDIIAEGWTRSDGCFIIPRDACDQLNETARVMSRELECRLAWPDIAEALRGVLEPAEPAEPAATAPAEPATEPTLPPLPPGWKWHIHGIGAYIHPYGQPIIEAKIDKFGMELFGNVPLPVIAAVLRRAGVNLHAEMGG